MTNEQLQNSINAVKNVAAFTALMRSSAIDEQTKLAEYLCAKIFIKSHTPRNPIDDSTVLYHPIEEEIVKAIASGIDVDDFVAQFVSMDMQSSASMLRRRYHKIAHLLSIYQAYSKPPMQINLDGKI